MKKIGIIALLIAAVLMTSLIAACGEGGGGQKSKDVTITMIDWLGGDAAESMDMSVRGFEEETGIKVDMQRVGWGDYTAKLLTGFASGTAPDVMMAHGENHFAPFIEAGGFEPLDSWIEKTDYDLSRVFPSLVGFCTYNDGFIYTLPTVNEWMSLAYNLDIFDEAGVPHPPALGWTWDDLFDVLPLLAKDIDGDGKLDIYGIVGIHIGWINTLMRSQSGIPFIENGKAVWDTPEMLELVTKFTDIAIEYGPPPGAEMNPFIAGEAAMHLDWIGPHLENGPLVGFRMAIVDIPQIKGTSRFVMATAVGNGLNAKSENKEEAFSLIAYMCSEQGEMDRVTGTFAPCGPGEAWDVYTEPSDKFPFDAFRVQTPQSTDRGAVFPITKWFATTMSTSSDIMSSEYNAVLTGSSTVKEFLERMQTFSDDAISREND